MNKQQVLIVEDESAIADTLVYALQTEGFIVTWKSLAGDALQHLAEHGSDIVILDIGLPDKNGFELCKDIRQSGKDFANIPILFLTARKEEVDRIIGLEIGGDDYVTKPFSPREVTARIKVILRRISPDFAPAQTAAGSMIGPFLLDSERARIDYYDQPLELTRYEYLILKIMLMNPERVYSRAQLMDHVWDEPETSYERAVDTHIKSLRSKLRQVNASDDPIRTHRGLGYSITCRQSG